MTAPILVTGGTGTLGRHVVPLLLDAGTSVRTLSRTASPSTDRVEHAAGDLSTGYGVDLAMQGVKIVLHLAGSAKGDGEKARTLVDAAARAGVKHIVYISVVGADRVPVVSGIDRGAFGYYASKRAAEEIIASSGIPFTILRATQFQALTFTAVEAVGKLPIVPSPAGIRFQPIDSAEVATRLVELALGAPAGLVPDLGGPRVYPMEDLIRSYLASTGKRRPILKLGMPGKAAAALRAGANLTTLDRAVGVRTWEEFLADKSGVSATVS